ncbi:hypothetical protein [Hoeflea prorocentri]|uniref:Uncharacterized protein n=1 Tax=Hoeflea prorocentri TaxID=1922333 RepID=A0A9X3UHL9_9HYPH|nr:hypothetical protein [Hoeflea prorocentri]MCY6380980.1 hypothetical protein [Hoeflea prorocentri]MDA5398780.1 hypothetical protein [Hoeflea prorocentri]
MRVFLFAGILFFSGCFTVTRWHVLERVRSALPDVNVYATKAFYSDFNCVAGVYSVQDDILAEQVLESSAPAPYRELGKTWIEVSSFKHFLEQEKSGPDQLTKEILDVVGYAEDCLEKIDASIDMIYRSLVIMTFSKNRSSVLSFLRSDMSKIYYLA